MKNNTGVKLFRGDLVKMSDSCKQGLIDNDCKEHVDEFGECIGVVEGLVDWGEHKGPEVDVRWFPSELRYAYNPKTDLIKVSADAKKLYEDTLKEKLRKEKVEMGIYMNCEGNKGLLLASSITPLAPDIGEYIEVNGLRVSKKVFKQEYETILDAFNLVLDKIQRYGQ